MSSMLSPVPPSSAAVDDPEGILGRLARGSLWSGIGAAAFQALLVLSAISAARILGAEDFGRLGVIQATIVAFSVLAGLGLGVTATKHTAELRTTDRERLGQILGLVFMIAIVVSLAMGALLSAAAQSIADWSDDPTLAGPVRLSSPILLTTTVYQISTSGLIGLERFRAFAGVGLVSGIATLSAVTGGAVLGGLNGAVGGLIIAGVVSMAIAVQTFRVHALRSHVSVTVHRAWSQRRLLVSFSLPALLSSVAVSPALWVLIVLLARQINGLAEIAIYNASRQWWMIVLFIPTVVGRTLLPILTERITIGDAAGVRKILVWSTGLVGGVAIPLALAATRFREPILSLFGDDFTSGGSTLVLMVWAAVLAAVQVPLAQTFAAANRLWLGLLTNIAWALVLLLTFLALGSIGARGIAISLTVAYGLHLVWTLVLVQVVLRRKIGSRTTGDSMYPSI